MNDFLKMGDFGVASLGDVFPWEFLGFGETASLHRVDVPQRISRRCLARWRGKAIGLVAAAVVCFLREKS